MTCTASLSPVVKYHGLARRHLVAPRLLMRPLLNGGTLGGQMTIPGLITTPIAELVCDLPSGIEPTGEHCRFDFCAACNDKTWQVLHGYTLSGQLWKGHVCACHDWQCSGCGKRVDPVGECCR